MKCSKCGNHIQAVEIGKFMRDGSDIRSMADLSEYAGCVMFDTDPNWTGYELTEDEMREDIRCPICGKYPFSSEEIQVHDLVMVYLYNKPGDATAEPIEPSLVDLNELERNLESKTYTIIGDQKYISEWRLMEAVEGTAVIDPVTAAGVCRCRECQQSYQSKGSSTGWKCKAWGIYSDDCECDPDGFCNKGKRREVWPGK